MKTRIVLWFAALVVGCSGAARSESTVQDSFADIFPSLLVTNSAVLAILEHNGLSFGHVLGVDGETAAQLVGSPAYVDMTSTIVADIGELSKRTATENSTRYRLFDVAWLRSARAHFELVGIVNRIDLGPPHCGETRLIYRLAYQPPNRPKQRLPMTVNVIFDNKTDSCRELAESWLALENRPALAQRLLEGPLSRLAADHFERLEINLQSMRANSTGPSIDDHAEYILRGFLASNGGLVEDRLRDTPDVSMSTASKARLQDWILAHLDSIDKGPRMNKSTGQELCGRGWTT